MLRGIQSVLRTDPRTFVRQLFKMTGGEETEGGYGEEMAEEWLRRVPIGRRPRRSTRRGSQEGAAMGERLAALKVPMLLAQHKGCLMFTDGGLRGRRGRLPSTRTSIRCDEKPSTSAEFVPVLREFCASLAPPEPDRARPVPTIARHGEDLAGRLHHPERRAPRAPRSRSPRSAARRLLQAAAREPLEVAVRRWAASCARRSRGPLDDETWERLEEVLIYADVGARTTAKVVERLEREAEEGTIGGGDDLERRLRESLAELARVGDDRIDVSHQPTVLLTVGVNGTGKTTTIGKMAWHLREEAGLSVIMAAADTYRAAAQEQLAEWARARRQRHRERQPRLGPGRGRVRRDRGGARRAATTS